MIIIGTNDLCLQEKLLSKTDLTLEFVIKAGQTAEATRILVELQPKKKKAQGSKFHKSEKQKQNTTVTIRRGEAWGNLLPQRSEKIAERKFCSYSQFRGNCPAYHQICNARRKRNHFAKMCPSSKHLKEIMQNYSESPVAEEEQTYVGCIKSKTQSITHKWKIYEVNSTSEYWFVTLEIKRTKKRFKIDSGSQVNIIPKKDYQLLKNKPGLKPIRTSSTAHNGTSIPVLRKWTVQIPHGNKTYDMPVIVKPLQCWHAPNKNSCQYLKVGTCFPLKM